MKDIFSYNNDTNKNAYVNWRTDQHDHIHNMIVIADGFMLSAITSAKDALNDNWDKKADILVFPMLFSANHAIELYLKAILWTLNILLRKDSRIEGRHDIQQIYQTVCNRVIEFKQDKNEKMQFRTMTKNLEQYINELFVLISETKDNKFKDNMDFSRYPFSDKYVPHFYINEFKNVVVDLENFTERFGEIGNNLRLIAEHYLYDYLQAENE